MRAGSRFSAGETGFKAGANGEVVAIGSSAALHADPSFEDPAFPDYSFFWQVGACAVDPDTDDPLDGAQAALVGIVAAGQQIIQTMDVAVEPGQVLEVGIWGQAVSGVPNCTVGMLTSPTAAPDFFDADTAQSESAPQTLGAQYSQIRQSFTVPADHTTARFFWRVSSDDALAAQARVDASFSAVTGSVIPSLEWGQGALSGDVTPSGTTNSTLTGMSVPVTCPGPTAVYRVDISVDVAFTGVQTNVIELLVDGVAQGSTINQASSATGDRHSGAQHWMVTGLSAGAHAFTSRTRNTGAGTAATVKSGHTKITVLRITG